MYRVTISTDNDAFAPDPAPELATILRTLAAQIEAGADLGYTYVLVDTNGNTCGTARLER